MVEQLICNQQAKGSSPFVSSNRSGSREARLHATPSGPRGGLFTGIAGGYGGVPEWLKRADCKSAGVSLRRFESFPHHGLGLGARKQSAGVAQLVEHQPSKLRVAGSSPV